MDNETRTILDAVLGQIGELAGLIGRLNELVADVDREQQKLAADVADMGRRLTLLDLAVTGEAARRETADAEITERITAVHREAIRELTRKAERSTTA